MQITATFFHKRRRRRRRRRRRKEIADCICISIKSRMQSQ